MKTCRNCNQELTDDILFCPKCGTKIEDTEPKQEIAVETPSEMKQGDEKTSEERPARSQAFWFGVFGGGFVAFLILCFLLLQWKPGVAMGALQHGSMILGCLCLSHWWMGRKKKEKRIASVVFGVLFFFLSSAAKEFQPEIMYYSNMFASSDKKMASTLVPLSDDPSDVVIQRINENLQALGVPYRIVGLEPTDNFDVSAETMPTTRGNLDDMLKNMEGLSYKAKFDRNALLEISMKINAKGQILAMEIPSDSNVRLAVLVALNCPQRDIVQEQEVNDIKAFYVRHFVPTNKSKDIIISDNFNLRTFCLWAFSPDTWVLRTENMKRCSFDYIKEAKQLAQSDTIYTLCEGMSAEKAIGYFDRQSGWIGTENNGKKYYPKKKGTQYITCHDYEYKKKGNTNDIVQEYVWFEVNADTGKVEKVEVRFWTPDYGIAKQIADVFAVEPAPLVNIDGLAFIVEKSRE